MEVAQNIANDTNVHACAACKHQHKRCQFEACPLALYFPANKTEEFQNAHRVYGMNNLIRNLHSVPEHLRHKTAETLILEATMRKEFPVHGSLAVQAQTSVLISVHEKELEFVKKQISIVKKMKRLILHTYNHRYGRNCPQPPPTFESTSDANLESETIVQADNFEYGEDFGECKCLDMQRLDELIDSYHAFTNIGILLGEPRSEARGKQPVGCDKSKEMEDEEATHGTQLI